MTAHVDRTTASAEEFSARLDAIEAAQPAPESWVLQRVCASIVEGERQIASGKPFITLDDALDAES